MEGSPRRSRLTKENGPHPFGLKFIRCELRIVICSIVRLLFYININFDRKINNNYTSFFFAFPTVRTAFGSK